MKNESAATAARPIPSDLGRGTSQTGGRLYNERLILTLIRRHGSLPKAEIARLTGLSAQTISVIMKQLEADGLLIKERPQRGRIGQPSVPFSLNPEGAFFLGLKIGRRSGDLVLLDFVGRVLNTLHETYPYPTPAGVLDFVERGTDLLVRDLTPSQYARIGGIGIAAPFELWNWREQIGAPNAALEAWRDFDIRSEVSERCPFPAYFCNDATAACGAELVLGNPGHAHDFLYFFIGSFIGGGVVLDGSLYPGRSGNAGALGSMPVRGIGGAGSLPPQQLIRSASIFSLEETLQRSGRDPAVLWRAPDDWGDIGAVIDQWIEEVAASLAFAIVAAISVIDFESVIIDGAFPRAVRSQIVSLTAKRVAEFDRQGLSSITIAEGTIGSGARAIGGACLPLLANFTRDREILFKETL
ncbi:MAG TPA: ROK family transcriptional regulator [Alphaproteobacteria bacterium]|nr:ROK family transcriptional regulator [Alphaproteobacteria bacterium]